LLWGQVPHSLTSVYISLGRGSCEDPEDVSCIDPTTLTVTVDPLLSREKSYYNIPMFGELRRPRQRHEHNSIMRLQRFCFTFCARNCPGALLLPRSHDVPIFAQASAVRCVRATVTSVVQRFMWRLPGVLENCSASPTPQRCAQLKWPHFVFVPFRHQRIV
jgi:hypothetical protein